MPSINWTIIRNSALVGLVLIAPVAVISSLVVDDVPGWAVWLFLLVALAGFVTAGWMAGRSRLNTPILHGALAAFATFVVVQAIGLIGQLMDGKSINVLAIALTAILALSCGVAGALGADWLGRRRPAATSA